MGGPGSGRKKGSGGKRPTTKAGRQAIKEANFKKFQEKTRNSQIAFRNRFGTPGK